MHHYHDYQYEVLTIRTIRTDQQPKPIDAELWYFPPRTLPLGTPTFFRRFSGSTELEARRVVVRVPRMGHSGCASHMAAEVPQLRHYPSAEVAGL
jgi:hypothetical protein